MAPAKQKIDLKVDLMREPEFTAALRVKWVHEGSNLIRDIFPEI